MLIKLAAEKPFNAGGHRQCFVHPEDSNKCIKVLYPQRRGSVLRKQQGFPKNCRPAEHYDDNARELRGYRYINSLQNEAVWTHVPRYYGTVDTDMGPGSVTELIRDFDGAISQTLRQKIHQCVQRDGDLDQSCRDSVEELIEFMNSTLFLSRHLTINNLLSVRVAENRERLYLIEGFGTSEWIPMATWFSFWAKAKVKRKIASFHARIALEIYLAGGAYPQLPASQKMLAKLKRR